MKKFILTIAIALSAFSVWAEITLPRDNNGVPFWQPMRVTDGTDKTRFAIVDSQGRLVVFSASTTVGGTVDARQSGLWNVAVYQASSPFNVQQGTNQWVVFLNTTTVFQGTNFVVNYGTVPFSTFVATAIVVHPSGGAGASFSVVYPTQPIVSAQQYSSWLSGVYWSSSTFQMAFSTRGVVEGYGTFQFAASTEIPTVPEARTYWTAFSTRPEVTTFPSAFDHFFRSTHTLQVATTGQQFAPVQDVAIVRATAPVTALQGNNYVVNYGTVPFMVIISTVVDVRIIGSTVAVPFDLQFILDSVRLRVAQDTSSGSWIVALSTKAEVVGPGGGAVNVTSTFTRIAPGDQAIPISSTQTLVTNPISTQSVQGVGTFQTASTGTTVFPGPSAIPTISTTTQSVSQSQNWTVIQGTGDFRMVNGSAPFNATITSITVPIEISSGGVVIKGSVVVLLSSGGVFGIGNFKVVADSQTFSANISSQQIQVLGVVPVSGSSITIVVLGQITINSSSPTASVTAFQAPNSTYAVSGNMNVSTNTPAAVNYSIYESTSITISTAAFIFAGSGFIGDITVIRAGVGSALTVYDSASGATGHILVNDTDTSLNRTISVRSAVTNGLVIENTGATPAKIHANFKRRP